jgi:hypothetical protein
MIFENRISINYQEVAMNLKLQLPYVFLNNVSVNSFSALCKNCQGILPPHMIDAEITPWGTHIIQIHGTGDCFQCGHQSEVEIKIRDDMAVFDEKMGVWIKMKKGFCREWRKTISSFINRESLMVLTLLILFWLVIVSAGSQIRVPAKIVKYGVAL